MARQGDKFQRLKIFVTLVEEGAFVRAAQRLQLKSPTLTKAIQHLETELGCQLIVRNTRSMSLTENGQRYYQKARFLLDELDELDEEIRQQQSSPRGLLKITTPMALGEEVLGPRLPKFMKQYPDIELELDLNNRLIDIKREGFDVAIRSPRTGMDQSLYYLPIPSLTPTLVASPDYLADHGTPLEPSQLQRHQFVLYRGGHRLFNRWQFYQNNERVLRFQAESRYICNHIPVAIEAARQGLGIVNTYSIYVDRLLARGELIRLLPDYEQPDIDRYAFYTQKRSLSPKLDVFLSFLEQELAQ